LWQRVPNTWFVQVYSCRIVSLFLRRVAATFTQLAVRTMAIYFTIMLQEPESPAPAKDAKAARQSKSAAKKAARLAAQAGDNYTNILSSVEML